MDVSIFDVLWLARCVCFNKGIFLIEQLPLSVFLLSFFVGSGSVLYFLLNYFKVSIIFRQLSHVHIHFFYRWLILNEWYCIDFKDVKATFDGSSLLFDGHSAWKIITYSKIIFLYGESPGTTCDDVLSFVWVIIGNIE
jgi:hypothetical protein